MIRLIMSFAITTAFLITGFSMSSQAGEIYFCIDEERETITMMDISGECIEGENEMAMKGIPDSQIDNLVPIADFSPNDDCESASTKVVKVGSDKNQNDVLDEGEVLTMSYSCPIESASSEEN